MSEPPGPDLPPPGGAAPPPGPFGRPPTGPSHQPPPPTGPSHQPPPPTGPPHQPPPPAPGTGPHPGPAPSAPTTDRASTPAHHPPAGAPARHLELADLPPAVAERLRFHRAAPRRLRSAKLPEPVQDELQALWDGIVADVYDEVAGLRRRKAFSRDAVLRVLERVAQRLVQAERVVIVSAVHHPLPGAQEWKHVATGAASGAGAAVAEEVAAFGTMGTATTVAIVSAIVGEVFETYVAASARTLQYRRVRRSPDAAVVVTDLAEAAGYGEAADRRANAQVVRQAADWLGHQLVERTARRFSRTLVPVVGVAVGGGTSAVGIRKVTRLPLRPPAEDEIVRLADAILTDPAAYEEARARFAELDIEVDGAAGSEPTEAEIVDDPDGA